MWPRLLQALAACVDLLLPPACLICGQLLSGGCHPGSFCGGCLAGFCPPGEACCPLCAQPFPDATSSHCCGTCLKHPPPFSKVHVAGLYQGNIKLAIHRLKYRNQLTLAKPLGLLLGEVISTSSFGLAPDCVVPVPLHPERLRRRGFNQAVEIARPIARHLAVKLNATSLQRVRNTPPQQGLTATQRSKNLRDAFTLVSEFSGQKILLIDDVMTTGETVRACCRTLLAGGASEIQVAVIGRA